MVSKSRKLSVLNSNIGEEVDHFSCKYRVLNCTLKGVYIIDSRKIKFIPNSHPIPIKYWTHN